MNRLWNRLAWLPMIFALVAIPSVALASGSGTGHEAEAMPQPHVNWTDFGYKDRSPTGGPAVDGEEHMAPPLVAQLFNFFVFAGILLVVVGPRIKDLLVRRHRDVKTALEEAKAMKDAAAAKLAEYTAKIEAVDREVDDLVKTIKADADSERKRIAEAAAEQAAILKKDAEGRIEASIARARSTLEAEVIAAALAAAESVLRKSVNEADQGNLVEHFITTIESGEPPPRERRESVDEGWS